MLENFNLFLFHLINRWAGNPILDSVAITADRFVLLKGGISVAVFWWFWFYGDKERNRKLIVTALFGVIGAIVISRALTLVLPFHIRPMYMPGIDYRPPATAFKLNAEDWSSFPSDHAAMWFALSFGLWQLSRRMGIIAIAYSTLWVCLPRLYLGAHYPGDLLFGAVIGWFSGWLATYMPLTPVINFALKIEKRLPHVFYPIMFLCSYEMTSIFDDVRVFMGGIRLVHGGHIVIYILSVCFIIGVLIPVLGHVTPYLDKKRTCDKSSQQ